MAFGGGWAVAYLVTFASHFLEFARIFDTPYPALGGMAVIVGVWAWMAERRKSPVLAMVVTALGHFTILLSVFAIDESSTVSVFGILILSAGSAWFLLRHRWYYVAAVGLLFSYLNHALVMFNAESSETVPEFVLGMGVLTAYYVIFSVSELFSPEHIRRQKVPVWFRTAFVSANTAMYLFLGSLIMEGFDFSTDKHHYFHYALGAMLIVLGTGYWKSRHHDPMLNAYFTKASGVVTLGLAYQFSGAALVTSLAVEMLVLLAASRRSTLVVTRLLSYGVGVLALLLAVEHVTSLRQFGYDSDGFSHVAIQSALVTLAFWAASLLYLKTNWDTISPSFEKLSTNARQTLWRLDLAKPDDGWDESVAKHAGGYAFPCLFALAGFITANAQVVQLVADDHRVLAFGLVGIALLGIGTVVRSMPLALLSLMFLVSGFVAFVSALGGSTFTWHSWVGVAALVPVALATETKWFGRFDALAAHGKRWTPFSVYPLLTIMFAVLLLEWTDTDPAAYAVMIVGTAVLMGLSFVLHPRALLASATLTFGWVWAAWSFDYPFVRLNNGGAYPDTHLMFAALGLMILCVAGDRIARMKDARWIGVILQCALIFVSFCFVVAQLPETHRDWGTVTRALVVVGFLGYGNLFGTRTAGVLALLGLAFQSAFLVVKSYETDMGLAPLLLGFLAVIGVWVLLERIVDMVGGSFRGLTAKQAGGVLVTIVALLSVYMMTRFDVLENYLTVSWALLAVALFFGAVVTKTDGYRYAGLAVLVLSIGRVVLVDTTDLEPIPKALAYGGLGVVCLGLGWLYIRIFGFKSTNDSADEEPKDIEDENALE